MSQYHLSGLSAWLVQRLSAVYMALYVVATLLLLATTPTLDYDHWRGLFAHPLVSVATTIFYLALLLHAWVGVRDVFLDYAGKYPALRLALLSLLGVWLIALGLWGMRIMVRVMVL